MLYRTDLSSEISLTDNDNSEHLGGTFYLKSTVAKELGLHSEVNLYAGSSKVANAMTFIGRAKKADLVDSDPEKIFAFEIPKGTTIPTDTDRIWIYPIYKSVIESQVMMPFYALTTPTSEPGVIEADATSVTFDETFKDESTTETIVITNTGGHTVTLGTVATADLGLAAPFSNAGTGTCVASKTLARDASCTLIVNFSPTAIGTFTDSVELAYNDGTENTQLTVTLSAETLSGVSISPKTHDFGSVQLASTATERQFIIKNNTEGSVTLGSFTTKEDLSLAEPYYYSNGDNPFCYGGKVLASGTSCSIKIGANPMNPVAAGIYNDTLVMPYTDSESEAGTASAVLKVTVTN